MSRDPEFEPGDNFGYADPSLALPMVVLPNLGTRRCVVISAHGMAQSAIVPQGLDDIEMALVKESCPGSLPITQQATVVRTDQPPAVD